MRASALLRTACVTRHTLTSPSPLIRSRGALKSPSELSASLENDFAIYPDFFSPAESRTLLQLALWKLDRVDSTRRRRRRGAAPPSPSSAESPEKGKEKGAPLQDAFVGPYGFEEGHFDSVIHNYRESLITNLPPDATPELASILARLYALVPGLKIPESVGVEDLPPPQSSTHALHLAPEGAILPHVDNLEAMGQTIVGASLGATRILRLEKEGEEEHGWEVLLPSGSVYVQKGDVRYKYKHSILAFGKESKWDGIPLPRGHRVSFMVRDMPARPTTL